MFAVWQFLKDSKLDVPMWILTYFSPWGVLRDSNIAVSTGIPNDFRREAVLRDNTKIGKHINEIKIIYSHTNLWE